MNFDIYLLGTPDGYNQYPLDDKAEAFSSFHDVKNSDAQLTIYRKAELVYYVYTRNLASAGNGKYFGMAIALNGIYLTDVTRVFDVFEQMYSDIISRGKILKIEKNGKTRFVHPRFTDAADEIEHTLRNCRNIVEKCLSNYIEDLPVDYVVQRRDVDLSMDDLANAESLGKLLREYNFLHYTKNLENNAGYLDAIIDNLYNENQKLKADYEQLQREKKETRQKVAVVFLVVVLLLGGIITWQLITDLNSEMDSKETTIQELNDSISSKSDQIDALSARVVHLSNYIERARRDSMEAISIIQSQSEQIGELQELNSWLQYRLNEYIYDYGDY